MATLTKLFSTGVLQSAVELDELNPISINAISGYVPHGFAGLSYKPSDAWVGDYNSNDDGYAKITLPFPVKFYDSNGKITDYNFLYMSTNGFICFDPDPNIYYEGTPQFANRVNSYAVTESRFANPHLTYYPTDLLTDFYIGQIGSKFIIYGSGSTYGGGANFDFEFCFYQNQSYFDFYPSLWTEPSINITAAPGLNTALGSQSVRTLVEGTAYRITARASGITTSGVYSAEFDEVNLSSGTAERRKSDGTYMVSGYFDEYTPF
jgi:hypothetical protein